MIVYRDAQIIDCQRDDDKVRDAIRLLVRSI